MKDGAGNERRRKQPANNGRKIDVPQLKAREVTIN